MKRKLKPEFNGVIRKAAASDLDAIVAVEDTCFDPQEKWPAELLDDYLKHSAEKPDIAMLVAVPEKGQGIAGYVLGVIEEDEDGSNRRAEIMSVAVPETHRGQGIGRALLERAVDILSGKEGIDKIVLQVQVDNQAAIHLYEAVGFVKTVVLPNYYEPGDAYEMVRPAKKPQPKP